MGHTSSIRSLYKITSADLMSDQSTKRARFQVNIVAPTTPTKY